MGVEEGNAEALASAWSLLAMRGFGRYRSSGMGAFELAAEPERQPWLENRSSARGYLALSHFVPAPTDPIDGAWRLAVSFPKFEGDRVRHFLKGRITYLTPGSMFRTDGAVRPYYGSALDMAREEFPSAIHAAFCLAAPLQAAWWSTSD